MLSNIPSLSEIAEFILDHYCSDGYGEKSQAHAKKKSRSGVFLSNSLYVRKRSIKVSIKPSGILWCGKSCTTLCSYSVPVLRYTLLNLALTLLCLQWTQSLTHLSMCVIAQSYVITVIAFACYGSGHQAVTRTMLPSLDTVYLAGTLVTQPTQFTHTHKFGCTRCIQLSASQLM